MQCIRYLKRGKRHAHLSQNRSKVTHKSVLTKSKNTDQSDVSSKIESLYRSAFSVTKGKPSAALLNALKQQANHDGVCVTGEKIQSFEYDEMVFQNKSKNSKVRSIQGADSTSVGILNTYLDLYLHKNQLKEFLMMLQNTRKIPQSAVDQSILLRYIFKCKKSSVSPQIELTGKMETVSMIMGLYYQDMLQQLSVLHYGGINQQFVDEIISEYAFYREEFEDFKAAVHAIDPLLMFAVEHEKDAHEVLVKNYPVIEYLHEESSGDQGFPYSSNSFGNVALDDQLTNERNDFTQINSISAERNHCQNLWNYKAELQRGWCEALHKALVAESRLFKRGDHKDYRAHYCPILDNDVICLQTVAEETVNYICEELIVQYDGIEVLKSASTIGNMVYKIYCKQHRQFADAQYREYIDSIQDNDHLPPEKVWQLGGKEEEFHQFLPHWNSSILHGVGGFLLNLVRIHLKFSIEECKAVLSNKEIPTSKTEKKAVFDHTYVISKGNNHNYPVGTFIAENPVKEIILRNIQSRGYFYLDTTEVPMLCPPKPWLYSYLSPMLLCEVPFIRFAGFDWNLYYYDILKRYDRKGHLDIMKYGLDVLGTLPWTVNTEILKKQIEVYNSGGLSKLSIAPVFDKSFPQPVDKESTSEDEIKEYHQTVKALKKEKDERFSLRCTQMYTLSLANKLSGRAFWQCYNLDFRGRVYPVAPHFSQMLGDPARGMLLYNEGEPLGERGLRWLKIHCINKFGAIGKASFDEKERYADKYLDQIMDSADNMCTEKGWWASSTEDPWQCLAACIEITAALRSKDPTGYVSRLPVHMDGSCNGLQHYAALGRDFEGAMKVNVAPSPLPGDVYVAVMNIVIKLQEADQASGDPTAEKVAGWIERKTLKQTVMTQVYGVTQFGARTQIKGRLMDKGMSSSDAAECAGYLSALTFKAVGQLFTQAQQIQDWLNKSAYQIADTGKPVQWTTPLGLPCVQPYTKNRRHVTQTPVQSISFTGSNPDMPVNKMKQKTAFPPNFVHSQDSTHMLMTAIKCYHAGIPFAAVHDSFWTLPPHVDRMNSILREQFVIMYSYDVLKQLKESFEASSPEVEFDELPKRGQLDINCVKDSIYFFS